MATHIQSDSDVSLTSLVTGIVGDAQELMRQQLALFQTEIKEDLRKTTEAGSALGVGLAVTLVGSILLCFTLVYLLAWAFPQADLWVWFAVVGGVVTAVGAGLTWWAMAKFHSFNPLPDKTAQSIKENLEWKTTPR